MKKEELMSTEVIIGQPPLNQDTDGPRVIGIMTGDMVINGFMAVGDVAKKNAN